MTLPYSINEDVKLVDIESMAEEYDADTCEVIQTKWKLAFRFFGIIYGVRVSLEDIESDSPFGMTVTGPQSLFDSFDSMIEDEWETVKQAVDDYKNRLIG